MLTKTSFWQDRYDEHGIIKGREHVTEWRLFGVLIYKATEA